MRGREAGANSSCSIPRQLQVRNCRVRVALRTRRRTRRYGSARASPPPPAPEDSPASLCLSFFFLSLFLSFFLSLPLFLAPFLVRRIPKYCNCRAIREVENVEESINSTSKPIGCQSKPAPQGGVRCRTRHRPLDLRRHVVVVRRKEEVREDRRMIGGGIEGSLFSTSGILGAMDKDVRRKCGKVRRALFHLLLIVGGKFLMGRGKGKEEVKVIRRVRRTCYVISGIRRWNLNVQGGEMSTLRYQDLADPSYEIGGWFNVVMFLSRRSNNQVWIS